MKPFLRTRKWRYRIFRLKYSRHDISAKFRQTLDICMGIRTGLLLSLTILTFAPAARGWNHVGHRAVAEVAWRQLNSGQRRAASALLKHHPHYQEMLARDLPKGVSQDEWVFLSAAVWPDWVRPAKSGQPPRPESITKYNLYPHALGHPFLRRGDTNQALIEKFFVARPDAEMVLSNCLATLRDPAATDHDRAVSLGWAMHLMGDLHQPLHAASLVTKEKPGGDGLGGDYIVLDPHAKAEERRTNLHSFWDQLPGVAPGYRPVAALADTLARLKASRMTEYREHKYVTVWVQESFRAAVDFAYSENHVRYAHLDDLRARKVREAEIPTLSPEYVREARRIAERRLALAGQRLADELKRVW